MAADKEEIIKHVPAPAFVDVSNTEWRRYNAMQRMGAYDNQHSLMSAILNGGVKSSS